MGVVQIRGQGLQRAVWLQHALGTRAALERSLASALCTQAPPAACLPPCRQKQRDTWGRAAARRSGAVEAEGLAGPRALSPADACARAKDRRNRCLQVFTGLQLLRLQSTNNLQAAEHCVSAASIADWRGAGAELLRRAALGELLQAGSSQGRSTPASALPLQLHHHVDARKAAQAQR